MRAGLALLAESAVRPFRASRRASGRSCIAFSRTHLGQSDWLSATVLVIVFLAGSAAAQDIAFSAVATDACVAAASDAAGKRVCVGASADACIQSPGGYSTVGMGFCWGEEARLWDRRLNVAYSALMDAETALMEEMRGIGATVPDSAEALRDMQRAWIGYRDAACIYEHSTWGGGTGSGPAHAACVAKITAEQALKLEERLEERRR